MIRYSILFLSFLFASLGPASAGVRIINNGGGFAEMRALTALARIKFLVSPCLARPEFCQLADSERSYLAQAIDQGFFDTSEMEMEFYSSDESASFRPAPPNKLLINSNALYDSDRQPKKYQDIARLVFLAMHREKSADYMIESIARKIFNGFLVRENEAELDVPGRFIRTYTIQSMIDADGRDAILVYETKEGSQDLTPLLSAALKCSEVPRILDITGFTYEPPVVRGGVTWICKGDQKEAHFALQTSVLRINVFNVRNCEDSLK